MTFSLNVKGLFTRVSQNVSLQRGFKNIPYGVGGLAIGYGAVRVLEAASDARRDYLREADKTRESLTHTPKAPPIDNSKIAPKGISVIGTATRTNDRIDRLIATVTDLRVAHAETAARVDLISYQITSLQQKSIP